MLLVRGHGGCLQEVIWSPARDVGFPSPRGRIKLKAVDRIEGSLGHDLLSYIILYIHMSVITQRVV